MVHNQNTVYHANASEWSNRMGYYQLDDEVSEWYQVSSSTSDYCDGGMELFAGMDEQQDDGEELCPCVVARVVPMLRRHRNDDADDEEAIANNMPSELQA